MVTSMHVNVKKLNDKAILPTYGSANAAGADLYACLDAPLTIAPHETAMVHTVLAMELPEGYAGLIVARSGLASKRNLAPANKVGVVDHCEFRRCRRFKRYRTRRWRIWFNRYKINGITP